jgi:phage terminase small subunit
MTGRKPKPNNLKVVAGNPGKRPINEQEPVYSEGDTAPPDWLCDEAAAIWRRLSANLDANGLLTQVNRDLLAVYCDLVADYRAKRAEGKMPPMAQVSRMTSLAGEFGFTPSAASRIIAPKPGKGDGKSRFFG